MHPVMNRKDFMSCYELCYYCWREGAAHQFFGQNNERDLWEVKKVPSQEMVI
jgi:wyosine [tRNA(Phe)-imidazoG37] synthetase (radical SAM superfamily)